MSDEIIGQGGTRPGVNRRTVMKGAAWSVPVIMVASAAPATASSPPVTFELTGNGCKTPGNAIGNFPKGYAFGATFTNTSAAPVIVDIGALDVSGDPQTIVLAVDPSDCSVVDWNAITIPANSSRDIAIITAQGDNSNNGVLNLSYCWAANAFLPAGCDVGVAALSGDPWTSGCRPFDAWTCDDEIGA